MHRRIHGKNRRVAHLIIEATLLTLALTSGYLLYLEFTQLLVASEIALFEKIDLTIALVFLGEFFTKLYFAKKKKKFLQLRWWELLAAIPITTPLTQSLRLVRLLRLVHFAEAAEN